MRERHEFIDYVIELLGPFGTVSAKRMFGGWGVYLDGLMFALVAREGLWLKADEINRGEFQAARCEIFAYERGGAQATLAYYRPPDEAMEAAGALVPWARSAYAAALRANARRVVLERERADRIAAKARARAEKTDAAKPARPAKRAVKKRVTSTSAPVETSAEAPVKTAAKRAKRAKRTTRPVRTKETSRHRRTPRKRTR
ncbi:MAG: TfoX/Sxy family protein [Burkholderiales bacterium]